MFKGLVLIVVFCAIAVLLLSEAFDIYYSYGAPIVIIDVTVATILGGLVLWNLMGFFY